MFGGRDGGSSNRGLGRIALRGWGWVKKNELSVRTLRRKFTVVNLSTAGGGWYDDKGLVRVVPG
eukprot:714785-Hanusia_phi.AAC.1